MNDLATVLQKGQFLLNQRRYAEAADVFTKAIAWHSDPYLWHFAALSQAAAGRIDQAAVTYEKAFAKLQPKESLFWENYGNFLPTQGRWPEAVAAYRTATELNPHSVGAWTGLGLVLGQMNQVREAEAALRNAHHLGGDLGQGTINLAGNLCLQGKTKEALGLYQTLPPVARRYPHVLDAELWPALFQPDISPPDFRARLDSFGAALPAGRPRNQFSNDRNPDRKLRIGFVSGDFRTHTVGLFVESLFRELDPEAFDVTAYYTLTMSDATTIRLQALAKRWRQVTLMPDQQLVRQAISDKIDVMVDLSGHSQAQRLTAFAARMAPVQLSWLGYPASTGVPSMDYRFVDSITDPVGYEPHCSEELVRLDPCFICFAPIMTTRVAVRAPGPVTLGSFNELAKMNQDVLETWVQILKLVPEARFLYKSTACGDPVIGKELAERFESMGIASNRLDIRGRTETMEEHLDLYNQIDLTVDTFPYNGTTTSAECLSMGVPVVTILGDRHMSRVSASILHACGHPEWIAATRADMVKMAVELLRKPRSTQARKALQSEVSDSALADSRAFAFRWAGAVRACWRSWCQSERRS